MIYKNKTAILIYKCLGLMFFLFISLNAKGQLGQIKGFLQDGQNEAVIYANVSLHQSADSSLVKVETTNDAGLFLMSAVEAGRYFIKASYVGLADLLVPSFELATGESKDLGILQFSNGGTDLSEIVVTTSRALVEVKPDRTVFNVQGTINSVGEDALALMRKAPSVTVDNNDNISVLGRTGVRIFIDGKVLPLSGNDLTAYLQNLTAEQIDRIDIITNPGAKYEAEGNAGIIDIRLKRDENLGANGSVSSSFSQGRESRYNLSSTLNYRNKRMNVFGNIGYGERTGFNDMLFESYQNNFLLDEINNTTFTATNFDYRLGTDFFIGKKQTVGFLIGGSTNDRDNVNENIIKISSLPTISDIDSVLFARNTSTGGGSNYTFNVNYRYDISKDKSFNIDLDYGKYNSYSSRFSPNRYYETIKEDVFLSERINIIDPENDIDIYTVKADYEQPLAGGQFGIGGKISRVVSDNSFLFYDQINNVVIRNDQRSNIFEYKENVYAGYVSFTRPINKKLSFTSGIRLEQTDAVGSLTPFDEALSEPPVLQNYLSAFPNLGFSWTPKQAHSFNLAFGRRINRPDYNVLNPFENRLSELSFEKGNPRLQAEIVNNVELGWTYKYRYNFKLGYSKTENQITRLIAPDTEDARAGFITWANLAEQTVISANISAPVQVSEKWNAFFNLSASYIDNQADYGNGQMVDIQAFTYSIYTQQTFTLPKKFKGEISGYYSGPGVWGGVFEYEALWSLNLGLQRKFFKDKLNVKLAANDIFYQSWWEGTSNFAGLESFGSGKNDTRRVTISVSYNFGNQKVKSRKRKTGIEEESQRVKN
jgi:outer membrane receptor protein involved in Fe transport